MAQHNLASAADVVERYPLDAARLGVDEHETAAWRHAAQAMFIPYDETLGVHPQAEAFTTHEVWDFAATPADQYPLLKNFPYFDLYRKQVIKQADLVLAMHLRGEAFTDEQKQRNFAYYEGLTVRDSSLSACTQAVIAAETGHLQLAYDYLAEAALMDLDNLEHNTRDGLHVASLAGTWIALVAGIAGLRQRHGTLSFAPRLPDGITRLAIGLSTQQRRLRVEINAHTTTYRLLDGEPLHLLHNQEPGLVSITTSVVRPTRTTAASEPPESSIPTPSPPTQPCGRTPHRHQPIADIHPGPAKPDPTRTEADND
jgi:alpha,alpha-trehalose phosphorylase